MRAFVILALATLAGCGAPQVSRPPPSPAAQLQEIREAYSEESKKSATQSRSASTGELFDVPGSPGPEQFVPKLFVLAENHPNDPAAVDALIFVLEYWKWTADGDRAFQLLLDKYADSPQLRRMGWIVGSGGFLGTDADKRLQRLKDLAEKAQTDRVRADALTRLGMTFDENWMRGRNLTAADRKTAEGYYEEVIAKYSHVDDGQWARQAEGHLGQLRTMVGKPAPEIDGTDLNGERTGNRE